MSSPTPGPWIMETVATQIGICHKIGPFPGKRPVDKPRHACLYADYPSASAPGDAELLANARLVAAAPDLLEAARAALDDLISDGHAHYRVAETLRAAIEKATGGSNG